MLNNQKIKILLFCSSLNIGGTERNIVKIAKHVDKTRFDVEIFCLFGSGPLEDELKDAGIRYSFGNFGRIFDFRVYWRALKALKKNDFDIVHCFGYPTTYFGVLLGRLVGIPNIIVAIQALDTWKGKEHILLDRLIRPFVTLYIADSEGARSFAMVQQGIIPDNIITIYDGVDILSLKPSKDIHQLRKELGILNNFPIVGVVARLQDEHKGQSYFIKAIPLILKEFPDTNFLIVGDGADRVYLKSLAEEIGVRNKVVFAGFRTDLANIFSIIDILVIPSVQWESITKTMLEAMAMARPIVATNVGDICEIFKGGETGILILPGDSPEIANSVNYLLNNPDYAMRIGNEGLKEIQKCGLILEKSIKSLEDIYMYQISMRPKYSFIKKVLRKLYFYGVFIFISLGFFIYKFIEGVYIRVVIYKKGLLKRYL
ncbi:MAG: glycosyltransferase [Nitrospirae bacterium]|nr:glycosyltransferase [Nitrospirota bacterium]